VAEWFARADANHDGKLTESEFTVDFLRFFASLDLDHDGQIDGGEIERYEAATPELRTGGFAGVLVGRAHPMMGAGQARLPAEWAATWVPTIRGVAGRFDLLRIPEPVASMDTSLKGRISRAQAQDAAEYRFSLLDVQHHGYLLLTDLPETFAQQHRKRRRRSRQGTVAASAAATHTMAEVAMDRAAATVEVAATGIDPRSRNAISPPPPSGIDEVGLFPGEEVAIGLRPK
jgi:Ca2+-binding EF-hand superfamily protein